MHYPLDWVGRVVKIYSAMYVCAKLETSRESQLGKSWKSSANRQTDSRTKGPRASYAILDGGENLYVLTLVGLIVCQDC